ncbi:hypothetical protein CERSUDRAFT_125434 [Gelatoporia subvermispora B]|uniref:BTB domain-containing protein n=1 Tax=Ceriporiopsis subvermispora (strain B) TaxID=914234 RepID=M2PEC8_CERS8|nr:hypothetical protein CERSUDRAFT_125434 [Gelatoporia subvermispora B]
MAEPSQTSVKRRRDEMSNVLQYDFQRCTELWYSDGNVILVAGSTGFRVYRGLLARQSQAFNDMFLVPQPADSEQIEGCPVVRLSDDTSDLIHAFRALFGGVNYFSRDERTPIEIIAALARVTHKYGMQSLREQVLNQLKMTFPIQLPDAFTTFKDHLERSPILMNEADVIVVINLARLIEAPSLLPLAFYGCCQLQDKLITGVTCGGRLEELSQNELLTCIRGKDQLVKAREAGIQRMLQTTPEHHNVRLSSLPADAVGSCSRFLVDIHRSDIGPLQTVRRLSVRSAPPREDGPEERLEVPPRAVRPSDRRMASR